MLVINLFGGESCGKSTTRAGLFHALKIRGYKCEEAPEFVKQEVYAENKYIFTDQLLILAEQAKILKQLQGKVNIAVTDSPLLLSIIYGKGNTESFNNVVIEEFSRFTNINILLRRVKPYEPFGRLYGEEVAKQKDAEIEELLNKLKLPYITVNGDQHAPLKILTMLESGDI